MIMFYVWLTIIIFGLVAELIKPMYLFGACFSLAGLVPFLMSISSIDSTWYKVVQILLFIIIALVLIFLLRRRVIDWMKQYANRCSTITGETTTGNTKTATENTKNTIDDTKNITENTKNTIGDTKNYTENTKRITNDTKGKTTNINNTTNEDVVKGKNHGEKK